MNKAYLEILVEERSMETFLQSMLPKILPKNFIIDQNCFIRAHEGKSDLNKSIPRKIRGYSHYRHSVRLLILCDQDSAVCQELKQYLVNLIKTNVGNNSLKYKVGIVCRELENWYLGDMPAVTTYIGRKANKKHKHKRKYPAPDKPHGAQEMKQIAGDFSKLSAAKVMAAHMSITDNTSPSFQYFIKAVNILCKDT